MRAVDAVKALSPHARPEYIAAFEHGDADLQAAGLTTPARLADFLATCAEETGDFVVTFEDMNYTHASRICEVWPSRFPTLASAAPYVRNPEGLANNVYANRMGNGPPSSGDGYRYRGGGILQTTGRADYRTAGQHAGADFEARPELVLSQGYALKPALWEWGRSGCAQLSDAGNFRELTRRVNGGYTNMTERLRQRARYQKTLGARVDMLPEHKATATATAGAATVATAASSGAPIWASVLVAAVALAVALAIYCYETRPVKGQPLEKKG